VLIAGICDERACHSRYVRRHLDRLPGEVLGRERNYRRSNGKADGWAVNSLFVAAVDFPDYAGDDLPPGLAAIRSGEARIARALPDGRTHRPPA